MTSFRCVFKKQLSYFSFADFCIDILSLSVGNEIRVGIPCEGVSLEGNFQLCKLNCKYSFPQGLPTGI